MLGGNHLGLGLYCKGCINHHLMSQLFLPYSLIHRMKKGVTMHKDISRRWLHGTGKKSDQHQFVSASKHFFSCLYMIPLSVCLSICLYVWLFCSSSCMSVCLPLNFLLSLFLFYSSDHTLFFILDNFFTYTGLSLYLMFAMFGIA